MNFRLAKESDLPSLIHVFTEIIEEMRRNDIDIWDDIYPTAFFEEDIIQQRLYLLEDNQEIVSAFALMPSDPGASKVRWMNDDAKALYLVRFGVNAHYQHRGIGGLMLEKAISAAQKKGADYLRLFVVVGNLPAVQLYQRHGFIRAQGVYEEVIDDDLTHQEYGFEIQTHL